MTLSGDKIILKLIRLNEVIQAEPCDKIGVFIKEREDPRNLLFSPPLPHHTHTQRRGLHEDPGGQQLSANQEGRSHQNQVW